MNLHSSDQSLLSSFGWFGATATRLVQDFPEFVFFGAHELDRLTLQWVWRLGLSNPFFLLVIFCGMFKWNPLQSWTGFWCGVSSSSHVTRLVVPLKMSSSDAMDVSGSSLIGGGSSFMFSQSNVPFGSLEKVLLFQLKCCSVHLEDSLGSWVDASDTWGLLLLVLCLF